MKRSIETILAIVLVALGADAAARPKTDVVVLDNGDHITCEIKELNRGKLAVKTDDMGTVYIEWEAVAALRSQYYFRVETSNGQRYFGSLDKLDGTTELRVILATAVVTIEKMNVVGITPLERTFWQRNDGSVTIGYSFSKASDVAEISFDWKNIYLAERNLVDTKVSATLTRTKDKETRRGQVSLGYTRLLKRKWTGAVNASVERNDELDLARRFLGTVTSGASPVKGNRNILRLSGGLAANSELATSATKTTESLEGVLSVTYSFFQYNTPKTNIDVKFFAYPSITEKDRYRLNFETELRREIISDLFLDLTYFLDYDSKAPSGEGEKRDYGVQTSLGYSY